MLSASVGAGTWSVDARCGVLSGADPPSRTTLAGAFDAARVPTPEPQKRPRTARHSVRLPRPELLWQIDAFAWSLEGCTMGAIHQVLDDHARMAVVPHVADGETAPPAVQVMSTAIRSWGVPQPLMWDNDLALDPTRRRFIGALVDYLLDLDLTPITGTPDRPTTQPKNDHALPN